MTKKEEKRFNELDYKAYEKFIDVAMEKLEYYPPKYLNEKEGEEWEELANKLDEEEK
jgi:phage terminase small subunit